MTAEPIRAPFAIWDSISSLGHGAGGANQGFPCGNRQRSAMWLSTRRACRNRPATSATTASRAVRAGASPQAARYHRAPRYSNRSMAGAAASWSLLAALAPAPPAAAGPR